MSVKTRFLVISDTHTSSFEIKSGVKADVVIHCGDLTDGSKLDEYRRTLQLLRDFDAPLKLVIAGNHDFTLDTPTFRRMLDEASEPLDPDLVQKVYGNYGQARGLFDKAHDIHFLDEGTHSFSLPSGTFSNRYHPESQHQFTIGKDVDVVITHGPPHGIMDMTHSQRAGCPQLFRAIARARPRLHCFGHIHEGWGAKLVAWREQITENPSHFTEIDNDRSTVIDKLSNITGTKFDTPESRAKKRYNTEQYIQQGYRATSHCTGDQIRLEHGVHTLFVNVAVEGITNELPLQPPWIVDINLPLIHNSTP
ncbi:ser/Thr protein phosphatase family protein [Xylaria telfairii]|nr:ser/Thr protein phosphatase family protein [Xylaria telfairii]